MDIGFTFFFRISFVYITIIAGYFLHSKIRHPETSFYISFLNKTILYLFFPFLVISSIVNVNIKSDVFILVSIFSLVVIFAGFLGVSWLGTREQIPKSTHGAIYFAVCFPNSIFLPFPLILLFVGPEGLISATIFAVIVIIVQNTLGPYIGMKYGDIQNVESINLSPSAIIKKILIFPPALAMIIGLMLKLLFNPGSFNELFSPLKLDANLISGFINLLNWVSLILALLLVGISFNFKFLQNSSNSNLMIIKTSLLRLIFAPFIAILILIIVWFQFQNQTLFSKVIIIPIIIQAFSGPAIINIAFAKQFQLNTPLLSLYITIITIFSLILTPIIIFAVF